MDTFEVSVRGRVCFGLEPLVLPTAFNVFSFPSLEGREVDGVLSHKALLFSSLDLSKFSLIKVTFSFRASCKQMSNKPFTLETEWIKIQKESSKVYTSDGFDVFAFDLISFFFPPLKRLKVAFAPSGNAAFSFKGDRGQKLQITYNCDKMIKK